MPTVPAHVVAPFTEGNFILVDSRGALPSVQLELVEGETVVTALRRTLRDSWNLDAIVLETHLPPPPDGSDDYIALAVLDAPPPTWAPPADLTWGTAPATMPERVGPRAAAWLAEWRSGVQPPRLRPRWSRPGWHARAMAWIRDSLRAAHRPASGEIEMRRLWGISALARIPTSDGGTAWFKAVFPPFRHELAVTRLLERVVPDAVPHVIATDEEEGWLLLDDVAGEPLGESANDEALGRAIRQLVGVQRRLIGNEAELIRLGCPRRPLADLARAVAGAMADPASIEGPVLEPGRLDRVVGWVEEQSKWLDGIGLPETLVHGDFHVYNAFEAKRGTVIIDWSDASISHPLLEIGPWFGNPTAPADPEWSWNAWLDALASIGDIESLRAERERVVGLAAAFQLVSYAAIVGNLEPANRYQLSDGVRDFWRLLANAATDA